MSRWPYVVLLLATRCLYWGVHLTVICLLNCILQNVKLTLHNTDLDHQMPLPEGTSDCTLHSQLYSSTCQDDLMLYWSWPPDASTGGVCLIWNFELILGLGLASQRSFLWKTNKFFVPELFGKFLAFVRHNHAYILCDRHMNNIRILLCKIISFL